MNFQIKNIILFWSRFSENCKDPIKYIVNLKLPVKLINLDDPEIREQVTTCSDKISIKSVPSLLVDLVDGTINIYNGKNKILTWLKAMTERAQERTPHRRVPSNTDPRSMVHDKLIYPHPEDVHKPPIKVDKVKKKKKKSDRHTDDHSKGDYQRRQLIEPIPYVEDEDECGTELIFENTPTIESTIVSSVGDDIRIPRGTSNHYKPSPPTGLATGSSARKGNESLMASAKKMMAERDGTLGYGPDKYG